MIPIVKEHEEIAGQTGVYENCKFCNSPTNRWHEKSNTPVCVICATTHDVSELTPPPMSQTDKDFVLSVYPDAWKWHKTNKFWIMTNASGISSFIGQGKTESAAWSSAKQYIVDNKIGEK